MSKDNYLSKTIEIAISNTLTGGGPFGAIIVKNEEIIAEGVNLVTFLNDPTAHAEIQAIRKACEVLSTFDLTGCELYTSCEPCPMCFSAIYWAHLDKVYYAASHIDAENAGFNDALIYREVKLEPCERSIQFIKLEHADKFVPFKTWINKKDKICY